MQIFNKLSIPLQHLIGYNLAITMFSLINVNTIFCVTMIKLQMTLNGKNTILI